MIFVCFKDNSTENLISFTYLKKKRFLVLMDPLFLMLKKNKTKKRRNITFQCIFFLLFWELKLSKVWLIKEEKILG